MLHERRDDRQGRPEAAGRHQGRRGGRAGGRCRAGAGPAERGAARRRGARGGRGPLIMTTKKSAPAARNGEGAEALETIHDKSSAPSSEGSTSSDDGLSHVLP